MAFLVLALIILAAAAAAYTVARNRRNAPDRVRDAYFRALNHMVLGENEKAFELLTDVVRKQSENIDAYIHLGTILRKRGNARKALSVHKNLLHRPNLQPETRTYVLKAIAEDHQACGNYTAAAATLQELTSAWNRDPWVYEHLVTMYEKCGDWERAYTAQKQFFKMVGQTDSQLLALYKVRIGLAAQEKGNGHQARLRFREALHDDAACAAAYYYLGVSYKLEGRDDDALAVWKQLIDKVPDKGYLAFTDLSGMFYEHGDFSAFEMMLRGILRSHPDDVHTLLALADLEIRKGDTTAAEDLLEEALKHEPGLISAHARLIRYQLDRPQKAEAHIRRLEGNCEHGRVFECGHCHYRSDEPLWHCPHCGAWRSFGI